MIDDFKITKCKEILDGKYSRSEQLKTLYTWIKTNHITLGEFKILFEKCFNINSEEIFYWDEY